MADAMDMAVAMESEEPSGTPLEFQIRELENQIKHLVRSNAELEAYIAESGPDKELRVAIGENIVSIARRRAILEDMQKQVSLLSAPVPAAQEKAGVYL